MKLATLFTLVMMASTAFAQDYVHDPNYAQDVQFYLSRMQYSSLPDPADAGAADGAYYADLMANNGVKRVNFQLAGAKEMLNPHWQRTDERDVAEYALAERDAAEYGLAFTLAFNDEAAIRGMLAPDGKPFQPETKPAAQEGRETERWVEQESKGQYETPSPTPTPGPLQPLPENFRATSDEIQRNRARDISEEQKRQQALDKAEREARGDSSPTPGKVVPGIIIGATPAPW
jgi:hypothetical protein